MSEKDFDKGYKSGFEFGKEVANEEWVSKVKQTKEEIESHKYDEGEGFDDFSDGYIRGLFAAVKIVSKLIRAQGKSEEN